MSDRRRALPSVDRLLREPEVATLLGAAPRAAVVAAIVGGVGLGLPFQIAAFAVAAGTMSVMSLIALSGVFAI